MRPTPYKMAWEPPWDLGCVTLLLYLLRRVAGAAASSARGGGATALARMARGFDVGSLRGEFTEGRAAKRG